VNGPASEEEVLEPLRRSDGNGLTAVVHAALHSMTDCVKELVKLKADVTSGLHELCKIIKVEYDNDSPHVRAVRVLVECNAAINLIDTLTGKTLLESSTNIHVRAILQGFGADRWSAILIAAELGDAMEVERLKAHIADRNNLGNSALQIAARYGHTDVVEVLIKNGADVINEHEDLLGQTALHAAAISGKIATLRVLINAKADVNHKDKLGKSVLAYSRDECCNYLLKMMGADNWNPLMLATTHGTGQVEQYLRLREVVLCASVDSPMPAWLNHERKFYSSLKKLEKNHWTWGLHDSKTGVVDKDKCFFSKKERKEQKEQQDSYSCVLGSLDLGKGVHTWELTFRNVDKTRLIYAGIARGVDEKQGLNWQLPSMPGTYCENIAVIDQTGAFIHSAQQKVGSHTADRGAPLPSAGSHDDLQSTTKVPHCESIIPKAGFASEQILEFELDTFKKMLKMKVDNMLVAVVYDVDANEVRPYVCISKSETVQLLSRVSRVVCESQTKGCESYKPTDDLLQGEDGTIKSNRMSKSLVDMTEGSDKMFKILSRQITEEPVLDIITNHIISGSDINGKNNEQYSVLHIAASLGNAVVVCTLLKARAKPDGFTEGQTSCLHLAAACGDRDTLLELLNAKTSAEARDAEQRTPLHMAASARNQDAIRLLITFKANFKTKCSKGTTPLDACKQNKFTEVSEVLIQMEEGWTPLMLAMSESSNSVSRITALISEGEDVNGSNSKGQTSLHIASKLGHFEAIKLLIAAHSNMEAKDHEMKTPLHLAAAAGRDKAVLALVRAKAKVDASDNSKKTLLDAAKGDCKLILQMAGANEWTPLMVALKTGNLEEYLGFRDLILSMKEERCFQNWFIDDVRYYSNCSMHPAGWTFDRFDPERSEKHDGQLYSYMLGSEDLVDGVHTWAMEVNFFGSMWVGIGKNVQAQNILGRAGIVGPDSCTLAFPSFGGNVIKLGHKAAVTRVNRILNGFRSGDSIKLELDTHRHKLKMSINGVLAFTALDVQVEEAGARPLVIMDRGTSVLVDKSLSKRSCFTSEISTEDQEKEFDNSIWKPIAFELLMSTIGAFQS
jgi:ankyrin repeat protein